MKTLKEIYQPISKELSQVEMELKRQVKLVSASRRDASPALGMTKRQDVILNPKGEESQQSVDEIINHFFNIPGKRLRPALVLLSSKAVSTNRSIFPTGLPAVAQSLNRLIALAVAVELIHSASLIHDDIIDNSDKRRARKSLNKQFGDKIAVLAGDMLYTRAFYLLTANFDKKIITLLSLCVEKMCYGEINELRTTSSDTCHSERKRRISYLKIIENKTAVFMSACCQCGAVLNSTNKKLIDGLTDYGLNLGMAYQIVDDYIDKDSVVDADLGPPQAEEFALKAKQSISVLKNSVYKEKLSDLVDYILKMR